MRAVAPTMSSSPPDTGRRRRSPWQVVIGGGFASAVGPAPVGLSTLSLFVVPISLEMGFGRTIVTSAYTVGALGVAVGMLLVGRLLSTFTVRYVLVPSFILYGLSVVAISLTPPVVALYYLPYFFLGFFGAGTMLPMTKAIVSWFDNKRALATGIHAALTAVGASLLPLLAGFLIAGVGWRGAYVVLGLIPAVFGTIMVLLFVRGRAERHNRGRLAESTVETGSNVSLALPGLTFREAVRTRQFWQIILGLGPVGMVLIALQVNLVPMMTDEGLTPPQAALLLTVLGLSSLAGRLLGGFLIDRIHVRIIAPIIILAPIVGILLLHAPFVQAAAAVAFIGFTFGIESDLLPLTVTRYLGMQSFGKILGVLQSVFMITSALGPLLMGAAFDAAGSYAGVMPLLIGILVVCAIIIFFLGKYKYPPMTGFDKLAATDEIAAAEVLSNLAAGEALSEATAKHRS